jgi:competence ComEA-like helix-hairpin-helix protein
LIFAQFKIHRLKPVLLVDIPMQAKRWTIAILNFTLVLVAFCAIAHAAKNPPAKPIDINAANVKELQELPGVGPVMAQRIIDMRTKSGHFRRVEDLLAVRGISQKKLAAMRPYVTVSATPPPASPAQKSNPPAKK